MGRLKRAMERWLATIVVACVSQVLAADPGSTCSETDQILNSTTTCCPVAGKTCTKITYSAINTSEVCHWYNLQQQTAEFSAIDNYGYQNTFPSMGTWSLPSSSYTSNYIPDDASPGYYAQIDSGSSGNTECAAADEQYKAFNAALSKYNCENTYSHWSCNDCRKAYARWAAAIALPACGLNSDGTCNAIKPCIRLCNEVVQKCPITLGFRCPEGGEGGDRADYRARGVAYCDTMAYNETAGQSPLTDSSGNSWTTATAATAATYNNECCNSMGLTAGAAQHTVSIAAAVLVVSAWQLLA